MLLQDNIKLIIKLQAIRKKKMKEQKGKTADAKSIFVFLSAGSERQIQTSCFLKWEIT